MTVWRLVAKELAYRKLNFGLAVLAVLVAAACLVGEMALLRAHDVRAENLGAKKEARTRDMVGRLEDDYRKIMTQLGYNVLVLPKGQDLGRFYAQGYATETMPEEYARRLADSRIITVQHLLPSLQEKIEWPERKFPIVLMGTRGEVPLGHRDPKKPLQPPVAKGTMVIGRVLGEQAGLREGDQAVLLGKAFTVAKVHPLRGNEDDVTVWIDLAEAQMLLGKSGRINAILALSCFCAEATLDGTRKEIGDILDHQVQVVELAPQAATRRAARARAAEHGEEALAAETAGREQLRAEREAFAAWIIPLVIAGCTVWVGLLAFSNVRERRAEIGILRALGVRASQIVSIFLVKSVLVGLAGAALGYAVGLAVALGWDARDAAGAVGLAALWCPGLLGAMLVLAPLWSALAGLVPAVMAAGQDPAMVLREE